MGNKKRDVQLTPIIIGIIAALLTGQIAKDYEISLLLSTFISIGIAVVLWYGLTFFNKRKKDK